MSCISLLPSDPMQRLRLAAWLWLCVYTAGILGAYSLLSRIVPETRLWLPLALGVAALEIGLLFANLNQNRRPQENVLLSTLGAGNGLTLVRGLAYGLMAGFLLAPRPGGWLDWMPASLYLLACIGDFFDGYLARITNHATRLGEVLDMEFDSIGMMIALLLAVGYGQLPPIYLTLGLARFLFIGGLTLRRRWHKPEFPMTASLYRRVVAGAHMGFVAVVLWPTLTPPVTYLGGVVFGLPIVLSFGRDWLVMTGWIDPTRASYQHWRAWTQTLILQTLPPIWRGLAAGLVGLGLVHSALPLWVDWLGMVAAIAVLTGLAVRVSTVGIIAFALIWLHTGGWHWPAATLLFIATSLVISGGGRFTRWSPEDRLVYYRLGG